MQKNERDVVLELQMLKSTEDLRSVKVEKFIEGIHSKMNSMDDKIENETDNKKRKQLFKERDQLFEKLYSLVRAKAKELQVQESNFESLNSLLD